MGENKDSTVLSVRVSDRKADLLRQYAEAEDVTINAYLHAIIDGHLNYQDKLNIARYNRREREGRLTEQDRTPDFFLP